MKILDRIRLAELRRFLPWQKNHLAHVIRNRTMAMRRHINWTKANIVNGAHYQAILKLHDLEAEIAQIEAWLKDIGA